MEDDNPDQVSSRKNVTDGCSRYSTHKAGMEGLDKDTILQIIHDASKGSKFYEHELNKEKQLQQQIQQKLSRIFCLTPTDLSAGEQSADELLQSVEDRRSFNRCIVHLDMDAFYAAVEIRDQPDLRHQPVAVGSNSMLSTSNYVARRFGVRAGLPGFIGKKLCPTLRILPLDFARYTAASHVIREVLRHYVQASPEHASDATFEDAKQSCAPAVAMVTASLDEAYLDLSYHLRQRVSLPEEHRTFWPRPSPEANMLVCRCYDRKSRLRELQQQQLQTADSTGANHGVWTPTSRVGGAACRSVDVELAVCAGCGLLLQTGRRVFGTSAWDAVREMRFRVFCATQLTCSAGIGPNTLIAKIASDWTKPCGQYEVPSTREAVNEFVCDLPVRKVPGIGHVTERRLEAFGVRTCRDLLEKRGMLWHVSSALAMAYYLRIALGHSDDDWLPFSDPDQVRFAPKTTPTTADTEGTDLAAKRVDRKSMSVERTFPDTSETSLLLQWCRKLANCLSTDLKEEHTKCRSLTLKMKLDSFEVRTRCQQLPDYTNDAKLLATFGMELLRDEITTEEGKLANGNGKPLTLRLMGMRASTLLPVEMCPQLRQHSLEEVIAQAAVSGQPSVQTVASGQLSVQVGAVVGACPHLEQVPTSARVQARAAPKEPVEPRGSKRPRKSLQPDKKTVHLAQQPLAWHKPCTSESPETASTTIGCPTGAAASSDLPFPSTSTANCPDTDRLHLACPVCDQQLAPSEEINRHLDDCLSRAAIVEAVQASSLEAVGQLAANTPDHRLSSSSSKQRLSQAASPSQSLSASGSTKRRGSSGGASGGGVPMKPTGGPLDKFILQ